MSRTSFLAVLFLAIFLGVFFFEALKEYPKVDILALQLTPNFFFDMKVRTRGFVKYHHGHVMIDEFVGDFYLVSIISLSSTPPTFRLKVKLNGLPLPPEGSYIEVSGTIGIWVTMGPYYYLDAHSWSYSSTGLEIISDTATLSVILTLLVLLAILGRLVFSVLMRRKHKRSLSSGDYGFEYD